MSEKKVQSKSTKASCFSLLLFFCTKTTAEISSSMTQRLSISRVGIQSVGQNPVFSMSCFTPVTQGIFRHLYNRGPVYIPPSDDRLIGGGSSEHHHALWDIWRSQVTGCERFFSKKRDGRWLCGWLFGRILVLYIWYVTCLSNTQVCMCNI